MKGLIDVHTDDDLAQMILMHNLRSTAPWADVDRIKYRAKHSPSIADLSEICRQKDNERPYGPQKVYSHRLLDALRRMDRSAFHCTGDYSYILFLNVRFSQMRPSSGS